MWIQYKKKATGSLPYIGHNTNDKIDNVEEILSSICQGLMTQGIDELYHFIVFLESPWTVLDNHFLTESFSHCFSD